jgi:DNA polymerase elongation subunit (family B)
METGEVKQYCLHKEGRRDDLTEMFDIYQSSDWFVGYNNLHFDDRVIQWMIDSYNPAFDDETDIYNFGQKVINKNTGKYKWGDGIQFHSIDLMRVAYLDKSLKMVATNLEWPLIQDLPYPHDHYVQSDEVDEILDYNLNDVEITERLYEELRRDVKLRAYMSKKYGENLMSDSNSGIANKLLNKMYAEASGQSYWSFKDKRTNYDEINLGSLVSDKISFQRDNLNDLLDQLDNTTLQKNGSRFESFEYHVRVGDTTYKIARGGIHSENEYELYEANDQYTYREVDFSSYYPTITIQLGLSPDHLDKNAFVGLLTDLLEERLSFKRQGKKVESDALKILVNAIYGKFGSDRYWLYDPKCMFSVTINGQLFMLMLIEKLEDNGFPCVYAK